MAAESGLSVDTLRWYEKEVMVLPVGRGVDGRRRYAPADRNPVLLLARLRETGMTTRAMKEFVALIHEGATNHGRRIALLSETKAELEARRRALDDALRAFDAKVAHYQELIDAGQDCRFARKRCAGSPQPSFSSSVVGLAGVTMNPARVTRVAEVGGTGKLVRTSVITLGVTVGTAISATAMSRFGDDPVVAMRTGAAFAVIAAGDLALQTESRSR
ncbi:MerR family transcriptional regulator [Cutibacterium avidum]|uniref:MerR family transcriptional regulator n=1 Tax=Cutibacterium avidum TaxID=33010 RepID=UPI002016FA82|nr:MerR family transcriptional regulator [Cutibacterium avidum]